MGSLTTLLNEHVLTEGRKEDVMAKYPDTSKDVIETLSNNDPSGNNKYLEWMVKEVNTGDYSTREIIQAVNNFHQVQNLITAVNVEAYRVNAENNWGKADFKKFIKSPKDILSYSSLPYLRHFTEFLGTVVTKKKEADQMKKESDRVYEDENYLVVSPKTHKASCSYGMHSAWCVATSNTSHFGNYTKNGTLYFFISKKDIAPTRYWKDKDDGRPPYKTALLLKDNGQASWWSKGDSNYNNELALGVKDLPFLTKEMLDKVLNHNKFAIENRKQREIEKILVSSGFYKKNGDSNAKGDFAGFVKSKIFNPEQIIAIIRNDNWLALYENSETGKIVRETLGTQTIFALLRELFTTSSNLAETLKDLHTQEFLSAISAVFSDDQNRELASIIVNKLGKKPTGSEVGGDVKMFVDKWTMTPEQWEIYEKSSSYFFIGKPEHLSIETLVKGDRFNPKDHHALQMMMLKAKMSQSGLYALVTDKDSLDEYIDKGTEAIPDGIRRSIFEKAKKLG